MRLSDGSATCWGNVLYGDCSMFMPSENEQTSIANTNFIGLPDAIAGTYAFARGDHISFTVG